MIGAICLLIYVIGVPISWIWCYRDMSGWYPGGFEDNVDRFFGVFLSTCVALCWPLIPPLFALLRLFSPVWRLICRGLRKIEK